MITQYVLNYQNMVVAIISGIFGFLGGIVATWVKWNIEKTRMKIEYRRQRIAEWREIIHSAESFDQVLASSAYSEIRPHISDDEHKGFYNIWVTRTGIQDDAKKAKLLSFVHRIEQNWDLI